MGPSGRRVLLDALESADVRACANAALGGVWIERPSPEFCDRLFAIIEKGPGPAREPAVAALRAVPRERGIPVLIRLLGNDALGDAARDSLLAIGPAALPAILDRLANGPPAGRAAAIRLLAGSGWEDDRIGPAIAARLEDPDESVRAAAKEALDAEK
jgi:HEAT repeat protein